MSIDRKFKNGYGGDVVVLSPISMEQFSVNANTLIHMKQGVYYTDSDDEEKYSTVIIILSKLDFYL